MSQELFVDKEMMKKGTSQDVEEKRRQTVDILLCVSPYPVQEEGGGKKKKKKKKKIDTF